VLTAKTISQNNLVRIQVAGVKVKKNDLVYAMFHAKDWKDLFHVTSNQNALRQTCGNVRCLNPDHLKKSGKHGLVNDTRSDAPTLEIDYSMSVEELLRLLKLVTSSDSKEVLINYVST
jgi:hypothetical protein